VCFVVLHSSQDHLRLGTHDLDHPISCQSKKHRHVTLYLPVISHIKASLHHLVERKLEEILVVREFPNVFLEYLLGMPPERAIEFKIQLQPGIAHIAKSSYRMMPLELAELKLQLKDLLGKGYIHLSSSPWGCQSFFMKKKGEALHLCVDYLLSHPEIMNLGKI
jgi:hypothetical protein